MLVVRHETGSQLLGALAFGIGFITLVLAGSELFTENFMIPVAALVTRDVPFRVGPAAVGGDGRGRTSSVDGSSPDS